MRYLNHLFRFFTRSSRSVPRPKGRLLLLALTLVAMFAAVCPPILAQSKPQAPAVTADVAKAAAPAPAPLSATDLTDIENATKFAEDAQRTAQFSQLASQNAKLVQEKASLIFAATRYKILASHRLSPDDFDVQSVAVKDKDGAEHQEWRIVPVQKPDQPPH